MTTSTPQAGKDRGALQREPLLVFLVIGALVYAAYAYLRPDVTAPIEIRRATIEAIVKQEEDITGRPVTPKRRAELLVSHIDDEVLLREAFTRGLHETDFRVRKRLLNIMRSGLTQLSPNPSRAQLESYFRDNRERYESGESVAMEHVYFSWTSEKTPVKPPDFLATLEAGEASAADGDSFVMGNEFVKASRPILVKTFGPDFAGAVMIMDIGTWHGPIESPHGIHFVRVNERSPSTLPAFDDIESFLRQEWIFEKIRDGQQNTIDAMRKKYRIEVEE